MLGNALEAEKNHIPCIVFKLVLIKTGSPDFPDTPIPSNLELPL